MDAKCFSYTNHKNFGFLKIESRVVSPDYFLTTNGGTEQFIRLTVGNDTVCTISIVTITMERALYVF